MTRRKWLRVSCLAVFVVAVLVTTWHVLLSPQAYARRHEGALFDQLFRYPNATNVDRAIVSVPADTCYLFWCEYYHLRETYRLPEGVSIDDVKQFYLTNIPARWRPGDDGICQSVFDNRPPGVTRPTKTYTLWLADNMVLLLKGGRHVPITIEPPFVTVGSGSYGCA